MRHEGDERRWRVEVRQVADRPIAAGETNFGARDARVRPLEKALQQAQLVEDLHRRGVDGVAAEIAEEIGVLFEHGDGASRPREEEPGHHAGGPPADHDQIAVHRAQS